MSEKNVASVLDANEGPRLSFGKGNVDDDFHTPPEKSRHAIGPLEMIALSFNTCQSWAGVNGSMQAAMLLGGPVGLVYGMIVSSFSFLCIALVMAELISVYPTAGGQYHFASILAPERFRREISYICGLFSVVLWLALISSAAMLTVYSILTLVGSFHPDYVPPNWHYFLVYEAFHTSVLFYNIFFVQRTSWIHDIGFFFSLTFFISAFVAILARSSPKQPSSFVWTTFLNYSGWSDGMCFLINISTTCYLFGGLDSSMHMVEQAEKPRKAVPRAMILSVFIGFVTALPYIVALIYSMTDVDAVLESSGLVSFVVWFQALRSETGARVFSILSIFLGWFTTNAMYQTNGRLTVAFARDNAMYGSKYIHHVVPKLDAPVTALLGNWTVVTFFGSLFLASDVVFNAILASTVCLALFTYLIPSALLLYRRRSAEFLPSNRAFKLPETLGWVLNVYVVIFTAVLSVIFMFPMFLPVTTENFNYNVAIVVVTVFVGVVNWFVYARHHFHGPQIEIQD